MADPSPQRTDLGALIDQIAALRRAVDELRSPTGTQQYNAVPKLQAAVEELQGQQAQLTAQQEVIVDLVDGIQATLTDFIANDVAAIVDAAINAKLASADITIGQTGGVVRMPSILTTGVGSASGRVAVWAAGDGRVGNTA